jgi:hypothetical protein
MGFHEWQGVLSMKRTKAVVSVAIIVSLSLSVLIGCGNRGVHLSHEPFDEVLKHHVVDGLVDYEALREDKSFAEFVAAIAEADLGFYKTRDESLAFWINARNAMLLNAVISRHSMHSVARIVGFFDTEKHQVAGQGLTLNEMNDEIWDRFRDARVFFVLSMGAVGGPTLESRAFFADGLDGRLEEATRRSIVEDGMASLDREDASLGRSAVFSWYEDAFVEDAGSVEAFVARYLSPQDQAFIAEHEIEFGFLLYDWALNAQPGDE